LPSALSASAMTSCVIGESLEVVYLIL
jgi:hypothetical protein